MSDEMPQASAGPNARARAKVWIVALAIGAAAGWWGRGVVLETWGPHLRVDRVAVAGNARVAASELVATAGLRGGLPLSAFDPERVRLALAAHPWIREARVTTLPTGRIILAVTEREPVGFAVIADERVLIDGDGVAFAEAADPVDVPEFLGVPEVTRGVGHPRFAQAIRLLQAADREGLPTPAEVRLGGRDENELPAVSWNRAEDGALTAVLGAEDPAVGFHRLAQVWMAGLPEFRSAFEVDLRFGEQLILRAAVAPGDENHDASGTAVRAAGPEQSREG